MKISTRGRYALRLMIDLAQNKEQGNISGGQPIQSDQLGELIALLRSGAIAINLDGKKVSTALAGVSAT